MKITFGGIQLTDWSDYPAQNVAVNGETVFEAVDIVRAAAKRFYPRGNDQVTLAFTVRREFATHHEAQVYFLTAYSTLPKFATCSIICGVPGEEDDEQEVFIYNAVLATSQAIFNGVEVITSFAVQGGAAVTESPPDILIGGEDVIMRGKQAIASGAETVAVVFGVSFPDGTDVVVTGNVSKPNGGSNIVATIREDLTTVNGFTAELSGPTPDANHKLHWTAYGI
jgi:hypothetical protein